MRRGTSVVLAIALGLAGGLGGYWLYQLTRPARPASPPAQALQDSSQLVDTARPEFTLQDLNGQQQPVAQWDGKVVLLNFWATWCPPCRKEIPAFIDLQKKFGARGLQIVGVAIDQPQLVEEYRDTMGINYPVLVGESEALEVSKTYGNVYGQLPYTVLIDRDGRIREVHRGELSGADAEALINRLL